MTSWAIMPKSTRNARVVWAALSTVALACIVVAVPVGLYELGGVPFLHVDLGQALKEISSHRLYGSHLIGHSLLRTALILAWISWTWMTMCVMLEIRSRVTGRPSARLPASRSVQALVALLVGTALAISTMSRAAAVPEADRARVASTAAARVSDRHPAAGSSAMPLRVIDDLVPAGLIIHSEQWRSVHP